MTRTADGYGIETGKSEFFPAIKAVRSGKDVFLTERGKPIAVVKPLAVEENVDAAMP